MPKKSNEQWLSIFDAVDHISHFDQYGPWDAELLIERGLAAGKIDAGVSTKRKASESVSFFKQKVAEPTSTIEWNELGSDFWSEKYLDCDDWERERGTAVTVRTNGADDDFELENLQLRASDFYRWLRDQTYVPSARSMRGRPRSEAIWTDVVIELIRLEREGKLTAGNFRARLISSAGSRARSRIRT